MAAPHAVIGDGRSGEFRHITTSNRFVIIIFIYRTMAALD